MDDYTEIAEVKSPKIIVDRVEYGPDWIRGYKDGKEVIFYGEVTDFTKTHLFDKYGNEVKPSLNQLKEVKLQEINDACQNAIHAGIEVKTSQGDEHFSLTDEDQINIQNLALQIQSGQPHALYHADGKLCRPFNAEEVMALAEASTRFKTYQLTYCNHLRYYVKDLNIASEIQAAQYGMELPPDLAEHMRQLLGG